MSQQKRNPKFVWQSAFIASKTTGNTGFIGLLMSTFDNGDGKGFFISANKISELTGLDERTVRDHISKLKDSGWLAVTRKGGNQGGVARASSYALTYPARAEATDVPQPGASRSEPEGATRVVDQSPLDPPYIDLGNLQLGDELPEEIVATLPVAVRDRFTPSFDHDGAMVFGRPTPAGRVDLRSESRRRADHQRMLRDEGLDETGAAPRRQEAPPRFRRR